MNPMHSPIDLDPVADHPLGGVAAIVGPHIQRGLQRLRQRLRVLGSRACDLPFDPEVVEAVALPDLVKALIALLSRPVVLELHVARLQGRLRGTTPEGRFHAFVEGLAEPAAAADLLREYPVLARQVGLRVDHWVTATGEFLQRLCDDWEDIRASFFAGGDPGTLVGVAMGSGDKHRQGRSVMIASFSSGLSVAYKPRSLAVDVHFQELLSWVNDRGGHPLFRTLAIIDRDTYGWMEFIRGEGCTSAAQISRFYHRQGGYLAILYALCSVDFHYENLVAVGEHPVLVDLEALFHPELVERGANAEATLAASVMSIGLLPWRVLPDGKAEGIDLSGLGAIEGAPWPEEMPHWESSATDEMCLARARTVTVSGAQHRPILDGVAADLADHAAEVAAGFRSIYDVLLSHRHELLAKDGLVTRFAQDEVRVIVRPTQSYAVLLHASFHPDVLRDAGERGRLLDKLWGQVDAVPALGRVVPAEREDLDEGDIPLFTARPSTRDLWTSRGDRLPDVLDASGLDRVTRRLRSLGPTDLAQQLWFIQASFASLAPRVPADDPSSVAVPATRRQGTRSGVRPTQERLLASACAIGDRLGELACRGDEEVSWIGLALSREERWTPAPLGSALYDGLPGVALFLAYLGAVVNEERFTDLARGALETMRGRRELDPLHVSGIGAFDGWGGVVYSLAHIGALWENKAILAEADGIAEVIEPLIERDRALDLFGGAAGCLMSLLALQRSVPSERTLDAAVMCGRRLLAGAQVMSDGIAWTSAVPGHAPLGGLSHGAAGIAMALHELWTVTGCEPFRRAALQALAYERTLFCADCRNWADLRALPPPACKADGSRPAFMTALCHGAPGIGLARLRMLQHAGDPTLLHDVEAALETTIRHGWGGNHSLCHGDLGNLELLLAASLIVDEERWDDELGQASAVVLEDIERSGWRCANPGEVESPELMTGLAGIGYELLRLAMPSRIPSVLVLAPPRRVFVPAMHGAIR
jgi:type 2 lantibiotic biosynthesis protein LanM